MGQLLIQVAGRAGRASKPGRVLIQTQQPDHPLIESLTRSSFNQYSRQLLSQRESAGLPPYGHLSLIRADSTNPEHSEQFLFDARQQLSSITSQQGNPVVPNTKMLGPFPAPMARKAGRLDRNWCSAAITVKTCN